MQYAIRDGDKETLIVLWLLAAIHLLVCREDVAHALEGARLRNRCLFWRRLLVSLLALLIQCLFQL